MNPQPGDRIWPSMPKKKKSHSASRSWLTCPICRRLERERLERERGQR